MQSVGVRDEEGIDVPDAGFEVNERKVLFLIVKMSIAKSACRDSLLPSSRIVTVSTSFVRTQHSTVM